MVFFLKDSLDPCGFMSPPMDPGDPMDLNRPDWPC